MRTLQTIKEEVEERLKKAAVTEAKLDARLLMMQALDISPVDYALEKDKVISDDQTLALMHMVEQRCARVPISQIFGKKEFWSLTFKVTSDVLTPRPDSETLIEAALKNISNEQSAIKILDLGTGSGCLLLTLLNELPNAIGVGIDISPDALKVAETNAENLNLADRAELRQGNWTSSLSLNDRFDIIISNPPYIGTREIEDLSPEVKDHEPGIALFAGEDGLNDYRKISATIGPFLKTGGKIIVEIGYKQAEDVKEIFTSAGFNNSSLYQDLGHRDRCLIFEK